MSLNYLYIPLQLAKMFRGFPGSQQFIAGIETNFNVSKHLINSATNMNEAAKNCGDIFVSALAQAPLEMTLSCSLVALSTYRIKKNFKDAQETSSLSGKVGNYAMSAFATIFTIGLVHQLVQYSQFLNCTRTWGNLGCSQYNYS